MKIPKAKPNNGRFHTEGVFSVALLKNLNPQINTERKNSVYEGDFRLVFDLGDACLKAMK